MLILTDRDDQIRLSEVNFLGLHWQTQTITNVTGPMFQRPEFTMSVPPESAGQGVPRSGAMTLKSNSAKRLR